MKNRTIILLSLVPFVPLIGIACSHIIHASEGEDMVISSSCILAIAVLFILAFSDLINEKD